MNVRFARLPKPDVQNYRDLRNLKSVRTSSFPAPGLAVPFAIPRKAL
jgi:hypothetical protein